jgi:hypothetical protein
MRPESSRMMSHPAATATADQAARQARADAQQELPELVTESPAGARHHGVEDDGSEDAAHRVDQ